MYSALAELSVGELSLIAGMAAVASIIGGVAGYGTGALMPLVLVPIVGPEPVVPIIAISALFTNSSRAFAFRNLIDWRRPPGSLFDGRGPPPPPPPARPTHPTR